MSEISDRQNLSMPPRRAWVWGSNSRRPPAIARDRPPPHRGQGSAIRFRSRALIAFPIAVYPLAFLACVQPRSRAIQPLNALGKVNIAGQRVRLLAPCILTVDRRLALILCGAMRRLCRASLPTRLVWLSIRHEPHGSCRRAVNCPSCLATESRRFVIGCFVRAPVSLCTQTACLL